MLVEGFPMVEQSHLRRLQRMCHEGEHGGGSPDKGPLEPVSTLATPVWTCYTGHSGYKPRFAQNLRFSYKFSSS